MKKISILSFLVLFLFSSPAFAKGTELTVYTAVETELMTPYAKAFEKIHPEIKVRWVRDSAGPVIARLLAEKDAPKADLIFGISLTSLLALEKYGFFEAYAPKDLDKITPSMRDKAEPPVWVGMNAWGAALCVNTIELEKNGLNMPESWEDLTKEEYKGHIVMPSPASSSTALLSINGWMQEGEDAAWDYMDKLHENIKMYVHSGSKPCQMAAQGETIIGISSHPFAYPMMKRKAPIKLITPSEGVGWDVEASILVKKEMSPEVRDAAQKFLDFAASDAVAKIVKEAEYIPARAVDLTAEDKSLQEKFLPMDFSELSNKRDEIIQKWREKYDR